MTKNGLKICKIKKAPRDIFEVPVGSKLWAVADRMTTTMPPPKADILHPRQKLKSTNTRQIISSNIFKIFINNLVYMKTRKKKGSRWTLMLILHFLV